MARSRVLIVGATGHIGQYLVKAALEKGHQVCLLVRKSSYEDPEKTKFLNSVEALGAEIVHGALSDYTSVVEAVKRVEIVISAVSGDQLIHQLQIVKAIKEVGTIKRFLPSEFGGDSGRIDGIESLEEHRYGPKVQVRRAIEAANIPYTYISANSFFGFFLFNLCQFLSKDRHLPTENVTIYGDGNTKAIFVDEADVAIYTMKALDDPLTINKTLYIRPQDNILTQNEVVKMWEDKIGITLIRKYITAEQLLERLRSAAYPENIAIGFTYSIFVRGDQFNFNIGADDSVEATELYPQVSYTRVESYLDCCNLSICP